MTEIKINKKDIKKWTKALRSGKYSKTRGTLQDESGYCCLGVACDVFIPKKKQELDTYGYLKGTFPDDQLWAPVWLQNINSLSGELLGYSYGLHSKVSLSLLNDGCYNNFNEIADILELLFIHEAITLEDVNNI